MNCVHEIDENDRCSSAILKKCTVCKRRCLYSKKVFRCKECKGYVHKRCLPLANAVADVVKNEETSPTIMAAVEVEENGVKKKIDLPSEESVTVVGCDPEVSAGSLPAPVLKNKKKKRAKKGASKNNLPPQTVANVLPVAPIVDMIAPAPTGTKASEIPSLDAVPPPPVANALPVVSPARTADVAAVVPSQTAAEKKAAKRSAKVAKKKAAARSQVSPTPTAESGKVSELPAASDDPANSSKVTGPAATIVRVDPTPATVIPCLDAVPPPPIANALPVVSVADETASAPARTTDVAAVVPSQTAAEKKAAKKRAKVGKKKAAARSQVSPTPTAESGKVSELPAASDDPANSSKVTGPAATIVRVDPTPATVIPCLDAPSIPAPAEKTEKESASKVPPTPVANALPVVSVADETASAPVTSDVPANSSKVGEPASTIVHVNPKPAAGIPCLDAVPPPPIANALPVVSVADETASAPARTTDVAAVVPSQTAAEKKAAKRRAKVAKKKAAARSQVSPTPTAESGKVSELPAASDDPANSSKVTGPAGTKAPEIPSLDANVPAAGEAPSLSTSVLKTTKKSDEKNASTSDVRPSLVANVVSDAIASKVGGPTGPNIRIDAKPAAGIILPYVGILPLSLATAAVKKAVIKSAASVVVASPSSAAVVSVPDEIAPASRVVAIPSKVGEPEATIVQIDPKPAAVMPSCDKAPPPPPPTLLTAVEKKGVKKDVAAVVIGTKNMPVIASPSSAAVVTVPDEIAPASRVVAIPSKVGEPAATIVRVDLTPATIIPCLDAVPPPPVVKEMTVVSVADETASAPARTADAAAVVPSLTAAEKKAAKRRAKVARKKAAARSRVSPTPTADSGKVSELPVVSIADETASAPTTSYVPANSSKVTGPAGTKAPEIPSLDANVPAAGEAPSLPAQVLKTTKKGGEKNASTSDVQPPLVANVVSDAIASKVGGPTGPNVQIDPKPAAVMPSCDVAPPRPTLSTATAKNAVKKSATAVVVASPSSAAAVSVPDEIAPASGVVTIPSKVVGLAGPNARVDPTLPTVSPRLGAPSLPAPVEKTEYASASKVPSPLVANALPAASGVDEPTRTAGVPSLTVTEKKAAKRRAKAAKKKAAAAKSRIPPAAAESRIPPAAPAADYGEITGNLKASTNPWITELKDTPLTGFKIASNNVTFVDNIASEEGMANIRYNPVRQGLADKPMLVRLDVCPDRIYLGSGNTMDEAQEMAAFSFLADMHLRMNE